jgi:hypothetical protein
MNGIAVVAQIALVVGLIAWRLLRKRRVRAARRAGPRQVDILMLGFSGSGKAVLANALGAKPGASAPAAVAVLGDFCRALTSGSPDTAYTYAAGSLRATVSSADFARELLPSSAAANSCTYTVDSSSVSAALATVTVSAKAAGPAVWSVALAPGADGPGASGPWRITALARSTPAAR